ncbi:TPA: hypothetical protein IAA91_02945 [Candidatus Avacholeplasma faecigallinarum]|nr:hypothetical protein [Candidatus Avacholeplasma faecigallinarum]
MENIEHLRKTSKIKLIIMSLATLLPLSILFIMEFIPINNINSALPDLIIFRYGIFVLLEGYIGIKISTYIRILTNVDFATNEVIKRNDERNRFIKLKTESLSIKIAIYAVGIALIVTAFINRYIFYTLLSMLLSYIVIYFLVKIYYWKKY